MSEDYLYVGELPVFLLLVHFTVKRSHIVNLIIQGMVWSNFYPYSSEIDYSIIKHGQVYYLERCNDMVVAVL